MSLVIDDYELSNKVVIDDYESHDKVVIDDYECEHGLVPFGNVSDLEPDLPWDKMTSGLQETELQKLRNNTQIPKSSLRNASGAPGRKSLRPGLAGCRNASRAEIKLWPAKASHASTTVGQT